MTCIRPIPLVLATLMLLSPAAKGQDAAPPIEGSKAKATAKAEAKKAKAKVEATAKAEAAKAKAGAAAKVKEAAAEAKKAGAKKAKAKKAEAKKAGAKKAKKAEAKKAKDSKKNSPAPAGSRDPAKKEAEKKTIQPLNLITFTLGVGLATISSHPSPPPGETANFDAKGHSLIGIAYDLGRKNFGGIHPFVYYNYVPIDITVRSGPRTFRGVWHGHQLGARVLFNLTPSHGLTASVGGTVTVTELNPSDFIKVYPAGELVGNQMGAHLAVGYEYAMMTSFHLGAQFSATFGTIGYTSAMLYSTFLL